MSDEPTEPPEELGRGNDEPTPVEALRRSARDARAQREADVQNGRAFEWQTGQDAYERWLDRINGFR